MKIEKINTNQIRCILTKEDLDARDIKLNELYYGSEKAKNLLREMMVRAFRECGFNAANIPLMVEAVPTKEQLILIITKVSNPEELSNRFSGFAQKGGMGWNTHQTTISDLTANMEGADDVLNLLKQIGQGSEGAELKKKAEEKLQEKAEEKDHEKEALSEIQEENAAEADGDASAAAEQETGKASPSSGTTQEKASGEAEQDGEEETGTDAPLRMDGDTVDGTASEIDEESLLDAEAVAVADEISNALKIGMKEFNDHFGQSDAGAKAEQGKQQDSDTGFSLEDLLGMMAGTIAAATSFRGGDLNKTFAGGNFGLASGNNPAEGGGRPAVHQRLVGGTPGFMDQGKRSALQSEQDSYHYTRFYMFPNLDQAIAAAKVIGEDYPGDNSLYKNTEDGEFYLLIRKETTAPERFNQICNLLSEYAIPMEYTKGMDEFFREHMKIVSEHKAIQTLYSL